MLSSLNCSCLQELLVSNAALHPLIADVHILVAAVLPLCTSHQMVMCSSCGPVGAWVRSSQYGGQ